MSEIERIVDLLKKAHEGGAWHGPSLDELLEGVTAAQAVKRPLASAHTIWEIVLHIATWEAVVRRRISGEVVTELSPDQDWPAVQDPSPAAWKKALASLERGYVLLEAAISQLTDDRLAELVLGKQYTVSGMLHGVVQHDLYHAGQIAMLKKAVS